MLINEEVEALTPRDLRYVVALFELKSFKLAARACSVSQPALSMQIKKVEELLQVKLFERTSREVIVTPLGSQIVDQCRTVLSELEQIGSIARQGDDPFRGIFRIGIISTLGDALLQLVYGPLIKKYPYLELVIKESSMAALHEELRSGSLDAVIGTSPGVDQTLEKHPLFWEPYQVLISKLFAKQFPEAVPLNGIRSDSLVLLDEELDLTRAILSLLDHDASSHAMPLHTTSFISQKFMVAHTDRVGIVPVTSLMMHTLLDRRLAVKDIQDPDAGRDIALYWRKRFRGGAELRTFAAVISDIMLARHNRLEPSRDKEV